MVSEQAKIVRFGELFPTQARVQDVIDLDLAEGRPTRLIILKSRRHRISTLMAANIFHGSTFHENKRGYVVAHDVDTTDTLFKMHKVFYENLDDCVTPMLRLSNRKELLFENPDSLGRRVNPGLRSSVTVRAASSGGKRVSSEQGAAGVGRGDRIDFLHGSEVAFWPNGEETFTGFAQAVPEEPNTLVAMESTANGMAGFFYEEWLRATSGDDAGYTALFLPWFDHPQYTGSFISRTRPEWGPTKDDLKRFDEFLGAILIDHGPTLDRIGSQLKLDDREVGLIRKFDIGWDQLLWRRWAIRFRTRNAEVFSVEYPSFPEEAFASSGTPRFDNSKIRVWIQNARMPTPGELVGPEEWDWQAAAWEDVSIKFNTAMRGWLKMVDPPRKDHQYIIGADVSHGLGKDSSALAVFDRTERRFVAYARDNEIKPDRFAQWLVMAGHFYNGAYIAPEFNGPGVLTCHLLVKSGYPRLYYSQRFNTALQKYTDQPGFVTDQKTRGRIIDMFDVAIENDAVEIPLRAILDEAVTFVLDDRKGRADHLSGCHDDLLFSAMIAHFVDELAPMEQPRKEKVRRFGWGHGPPVAPVDDIPEPGEYTLDEIEMMFL